MIDVTATMLPSTVMNDRSFDDQIASSAISADSTNCSYVGGGGGQGSRVVFPPCPATWPSSR
jgi:hypothetical protein